MRSLFLSHTVCDSDSFFTKTSTGSCLGRSHWRHCLNGNHAQLVLLQFFCSAMAIVFCEASAFCKLVTCSIGCSKLMKKIMSKQREWSITTNSVTKMFCFLSFGKKFEQLHVWAVVLSHTLQAWTGPKRYSYTADLLRVHGQLNESGWEGRTLFRHLAVQCFCGNVVIQICLRTPKITISSNRRRKMLLPSCCDFFDCGGQAVLWHFLFDFAMGIANQGNSKIFQFKGRNLSTVLTPFLLVEDRLSGTARGNSFDAEGGSAPKPDIRNALRKRSIGSILLSCAEWYRNNVSCCSGWKHFQ